MSKEIENNLKERQPVVVVMGHVDHGKSTLLDAIRNTNSVDKEIGGITQHISAYEVSEKDKESGQEKKITFLDTPGHAAFDQMRESGVKIADIAILIVSAEDGVMPQTVEAYNLITETKTPVIVALSKVDKDSANITKTKNSLVENGIYIEGMGGDIPIVETDAKTKRGLTELLETILLVAQLEELRYDPTKKASGMVLETILDKKRGITSTLIIKDGVMPSAGAILAGLAMSPIRIVEDFAGKAIKNAIAGQVIRVTGFDLPPEVNAQFITDTDKKQLEKVREELREETKKEIEDPRIYRKAKLVIPVILKTDTYGTYKAIEKDLKNIEVDENKQVNGIKLKFIDGGVGNITERDILDSAHDKNTLVIGFNVNVEPKARDEAERLQIEPKTFQIIYELSEWFKELVESRLPHEEIEKVIGKLKILKKFSQTKTKQVLGGEVKEGVIKLDSKIRIFRRDFEIGVGRIIELQSMKIQAKEIREGEQCGIMIDSKVEIIPGDLIEDIEIERKKII